MIKRFNYRAYPTDEVAVLCQKTFGCCRFVYNWALGVRVAHYEQQKLAGIEKPKTLDIMDISKQLTVLKQQEEYKWLNEVNSIALVYSLQYLNTAYQNFFRRVKAGETPGFPRFKNKHKSKKSFSIHQGYFINENEGIIDIPKIGRIKLVIHRPLEGVPKTITVLQEPSGKYYVSVVTDAQNYILKNPADEADLQSPINPVHYNVLPKLVRKKYQPLEHIKFKFEPDRCIGIDHGAVNAITTSKGDKWHLGLDLVKDEKRLKKLSRDLSRKVVGSENFKKNKIEVAKIHERIRHKRKWAIENITFKLIDNMLELGYTGLCIRKYDVKGMLKKKAPIKDEVSQEFQSNGRKQQRKINHFVQNSALGMLSDQIKRKAQEKGINVIEFNAHETLTTHKCSSCFSESVEIILKREILCKTCGNVEDIDINAAKNTLIYGLEKYSNEILV